MAENRRRSGRMDPEQLPLIDLQAQLGGEEAAVIGQVLTRLLMRMLAPRADPFVEAFIKNFDQTMMAGFTLLSTSLKEVVRDVTREATRTALPATPPATSAVSDVAAPTPVPQGLPRSGGPEGWRPIIAAWVRTAVDAAAGGLHHRDGFVTEVLQQFRRVMRRSPRNREATISHFRAQLFQPDVRRGRMSLRIAPRWQREIAQWARDFTPKLAPNQMLEIILRWHLHQIPDGHGRPGDR